MKKVLICFLMLVSIKAYAGNSPSCQRPYFIPDVYEIVSCKNFSDWHIDTIIVKYRDKLGAYINWKDMSGPNTMSLDENLFSNKMRIPADYDDIKIVRYGFIVRKNGKYGYYNITKGKLFDPVYDRIYLSENGETVTALLGNKAYYKENTKCRSSANEAAADGIFFSLGFNF